MRFLADPLNDWVIRIVLSFLLTGGVLTSAASETLTTDHHRTSYNLIAYVQVSENVKALEAALSAPTLQGLAHPSIQHHFKSPKASGSALNFGLTTEMYWIKMTLARTPSAPADWVINIPYGNLAGVTWFVPDQMGGDATSVKSQQNWTPAYRYHAANITLTTQPQTFYVGVRSTGALTVPISLHTTATFLRQEQLDLFVQALYFGLLMALITASIALGGMLRDDTVTFFGLFLLFMGAGLFLSNGLGGFLWSGAKHSSSLLSYAFFAAAGSLGLFFTRAYLHNSNRSLSGWDNLRGLAIVYLLIALGFLAALLLPVFVTLLLALLVLTTLLSAIVVLSVIWRSWPGIYTSRSFALAWACIWLSALVATLRSMDWFPTTQWSLYVLQIGTGVAAVLFSGAILDRIGQQRRQRDIAQQEALTARLSLIQNLQESEQRLEQAVQKRTEQLTESLATETKLREQYVRFGAMISHEFRNPLGVIEAQMALLGRELNANIRNIDKRIATIRSATQRLALLFEKWLQSDRLNNSMNKCCLESIEFDPWIKELTRKCKAYHANHRLMLSQTETIGRIYIDESLLQIAVLNLIDNACKYSEPNTTITLRCTRLGRDLTIEVCDEGIGIPEGLRDRVFDEYFRVNPSGPILGVGLGLPFVKRIAHLHGGTVSVTTHEDGRGTTFRLQIPVQGHDLGALSAR